MIPCWSSLMLVALFSVFTENEENIPAFGKAIWVYACSAERIKHCLKKFFLYYDWIAVHGAYK